MTWVLRIGLALAFAVTAQGQATRILHENAKTDQGGDFAPIIETDGAGTWITIWSSQENLGGTAGTDADIFYSRSVNNGVSWSDPAVLNSWADSDARSDSWPVALSFGNGVWIAAWSSNLNFMLTGSDIDVFYTRSTDSGVTWSTPAPLNTNAFSDTGSDGSQGIALANDGTGNWVGIWVSNDFLSGSIGTETDILVAVSDDDGVSWSGPAALNTTAPIDNASDGFGRLALKTDSAGTWIALWDSDDDLSGTAGADLDILFSRSTDDGGTWSAPKLIDSKGLLDSASDTLPSLATDGVGRWTAMWTSRDLAKGETKVEFLVSRSTDNGLSWSASDAVTSEVYRQSLFLDEGAPTIATDKAGNWLALWGAFNTELDAANTDDDIFIALSFDAGLTWATPTAFNDNALTDSGNDLRPSVAADGLGAFNVVWDSTDSMTNTVGTDEDIFTSILSIERKVVTVISGEITYQNGTPNTCAAVEVSLQGGGFVKTAVTDLNGLYFFSALPKGIYDVRVTGADTIDFGGLTIDLNTNPINEINFVLDPATNPRAVRGTIVDFETGEPLVGVLVELRIGPNVVASSYTCATGAYRVELPQDVKGPTTVDVVLTLDNYDTESVPGVEVPPEGAVVDESMQKSVAFPASLSGVVTAAAKGDDGIAGARVTVRGQANITAVTDGAGIYSFDNILGGEYEITASAEGYLSHAVPKVISGSEAVIQVFALQPDSQGPDVNGDGFVNSVDVQLVINAVLGIDIGAGNADVNQDGSTNSIDIQTVINAVLGI